MTKELSYSEAFEELQQIVADIEQGETGIDELSEKIKRAAYLIRICRKKLANTEEEVSRILKEIGQDNGTV